MLNINAVLCNFTRCRSMLSPSLRLFFGKNEFSYCRTGRMNERNEVETRKKTPAEHWLQRILTLRNGVPSEEASPPQKNRYRPRVKATSANGAEVLHRTTNKTVISLSCDSRYCSWKRNRIVPYCIISSQQRSSILRGHHEKETHP